MTAYARIGLLGGSFDPVHHAHLSLAQCARRELALDEVWMIPAGLPWQRQALVASPAQRWDMLLLALQDQPGLRACDVELARAGPSYTVDTLRELQAAHPSTTFVFILGADQLANLTSWRDWEDIARRVDLAVACRPGQAEAAPEPLLAAQAAAGRRLHRLSMPPVDVSATRVRDAAARGLPLDGFVPAPVARYIEKHRLYLS